MLLESELVLWLIFGTTRDNIGQTMAPQLVRGGGDYFMATTSGFLDHF